MDLRIGYFQKKSLITGKTERPVSSPTELPILRLYTSVCTGVGLTRSRRHVVHGVFASNRFRTSGHRRFFAGRYRVTLVEGFVLGVVTEVRKVHRPLLPL